MNRPLQRTPKGYDGTKKTTRQIGELLPRFIKKVGAVYHERPDLMIASWPDVIGSKLAPMTQVVSFVEGILTVKVMNSTLYSLLNQHEKPKLLRGLRERFPNIDLKNIKFRIG